MRIHKQPRWRELQVLHDWITGLISEGTVWIEEPPLAGSRNLRTFLHLSQVSAVAGLAGRCEYVPVGSWKKQVVGNGAASKDLVARWLARHRPGWHAQCRGDQNLVDATCLAIYGNMAER